MAKPYNPGPKVLVYALYPWSCMAKPYNPDPKVLVYALYPWSCVAKTYYPFRPRSYMATP